MTLNGNRTSPASLIALALTGLVLVYLAVSGHQNDARIRREGREKAAAQQAEIVRQHESLLLGCERGNLLRVDVRGVVVALRKVLIFTADGIDASIAIGDVPEDRLERARAAADAYRSIGQKLRAQPIVDCNKAFPAP